MARRILAALPLLVLAQSGAAPDPAAPAKAK